MPRDFHRGLGAIPSPPDERDFQLTIRNTLSLPSRFTLTNLGTVYDQGETGTCVACAADGVRMWQERRDGTPITTWATLPAVYELYDYCKALDGYYDPNRTMGTSIRTALQVLRYRGTPLVAPKHNGGRIAAYYSVPVITDYMKQALMQHGPLIVGSGWDANWFYVPKTTQVLKAPTGNTAGGHAYFFWGWDDTVNGGSWIMRNSWGRGTYGWTPTGNAYMAYRYFSSMQAPEAWWVQDILNDPIT